MQDLSHLAAGSITATSQAGGNMMSSSNLAMTAPGSQPVDPLPDRAKQGDPKLDVPAATPVGTAPARAPKSYSPSPVSWKDTV